MQSQLDFWKIKGCLKIIRQTVVSFGMCSNISAGCSSQIKVLYLDELRIDRVPQNPVINGVL